MDAKGKYILIEKIASTNRTVMGLELTEKQDEENRFVLGEVLSVGELVSEHGYVKKGDVVYYNKHAGHSISVNDKISYIIEYGDIVGKK